VDNANLARRALAGQSRWRPPCKQRNAVDMDSELNEALSSAPHRQFQQVDKFLNGVSCALKIYAWGFQGVMAGLGIC
jgi:hypothetical protein